MTSSRREETDFTIPAISAISGFLCIATGYLFLKISTEASFFPGGLLLATGFVLTCVAMILGVLAKPKSSRPDTNALRREYDLFNADKRAVEFDENGWRLFWYEGKDVRPWSCLRQVYDLETLLVLGTGTTYYWLPKAALQRDGQLERLKALAESFLTRRQQLFEVPLRPSALVYSEVRIFHNWRRQPLVRFLVLATVTLVAYWILYPSAAVPSKGLWLVAFVPVFLALCEGLFYLARYHTVDWSQASPNAQIMSDCIGYKSKTIRWIAEYRRLVEMYELPGVFVLYFDDLKSYHLIPKHGFSVGQIAQFRQVVRNNRYSHVAPGREM